jgi:hypothetical protein
MAFGDFGGRTWNFFVPYTQIRFMLFFFPFLLRLARLLQEEDILPIPGNIPPFSRFPFFLGYIHTGHAQTKTKTGRGSGPCVAIVQMAGKGGYWVDGWDGRLHACAFACLLV